MNDYKKVVAEIIADVTNIVSKTLNEIGLIILKLLKKHIDLILHYILV